MACKNCDLLREELRAITLLFDSEKKLGLFNCERADELQEACNRYKEEASTLRSQFRAREKEVESLWLALKDEMKKSSASELLHLASEAAQIACLTRNAFGASSASNEAEAVALAALKRVREGLEVREPKCTS